MVFLSVNLPAVANVVPRSKVTDRASNGLEGHTIIKTLEHG